VSSDGTQTDEGNPNGAINNIAGICNKNRNVFGMMPHPERACSSLLNNTDGVQVFRELGLVH
jgi:phosphoribosylformylglycinamidine synthase